MTHTVKQARSVKVTSTAQVDGLGQPLRAGSQQEADHGVGMRAGRGSHHLALAERTGWSQRADFSREGMTWTFFKGEIS